MIPASANLAEALPDPLLVFDARELCLQWLNPAAESLLRAALGSLQGKKITGIMPGLSALEESALKTAITGETIRGSGVQIHDVNGGEHSWAYLMFPQDENIVAVLSPEHKHAGQALDSASGQAVSMLGRMLAHELKNPLAGIHGATQLLENGLSNADDLEITDLIKSEVGRIGRLVDKMENFGALENTDFTTFNIHTVLRKAYLLFQNADNENVVFIENYDPSLPDVFGNKDQLMQVVVNLLANAVDAVKSGQGSGRIVIQTLFRSGIRKRNMADKMVALPVELRIIDDGPGISDDIKDRVFQPFVTAKANGHGLGLALVAKIVHMHGGLIEFRTRPGKTVFSILLPTK